ncbi:hypothetical protein BC936DRAFT_137405, partial [Jimgerdemannia flammicorona]
MCKGPALSPPQHNQPNKLNNAFHHLLNARHSRELPPPGHCIRQSYLNQALYLSRRNQHNSAGAQQVPCQARVAPAGVGYRRGQLCRAVGEHMFRKGPSPQRRAQWRKRRVWVSGLAKCHSCMVGTMRYPSTITMILNPLRAQDISLRSSGSLPRKLDVAIRSAMMNTAIGWCA